MKTKMNKRKNDKMNVKQRDTVSMNMKAKKH